MAARVVVASPPRAPRTFLNLVVGITLVLAIPAGYALARMAGRYSEGLGIGIFLTYLVPPTLLFIPLSPVVWLGLQDSLWALVAVYPTFTIPFRAWLMMGYFITGGAMK